MIDLLLGYFLKLFAGFIWLLPRRLQLLSGDLLAVFAFDILRFRRKIVMENLDIAFPEKQASEKIKIARESYRNLGRGLIEYSFFSFLTKNWVNKNFEIHGLRNYAELASQEKGVLLLTLHLGNGDLALAGLAASGFPVHLISKHFNSQWLNKLWFGVREQIGMKFIPEEKSSFQILRALKNNSMVVFVLDQFMGPPVGVATKFFGRQTGTAAGLALFSLKTGLPVLPGYTFRKSDGKIVVVFEEAIKSFSQGTSGGDLDKDIVRLTQLYSDKLESIVRKHPDQWMWLHRRWKTFEVR